MSSSIAVVFFGAADIAIPTLEALHQSSDYEVVAVVTQPDKPVGRKKLPTPTPVKKRALELNLRVLEDIENLPEADVGVLVAFGKLLKEKHLTHFPNGIVNMHPSLLPQWRGPAPIQYALLNGARETGISIMLLDKGMDTGPILKQQSYTIPKEYTAEDLHDALGKQGAELIVATVKKYVDGSIEPQEQSREGVTYSKLISRDDGKLSSQESSMEMMQKFRAFHPWPGVFCMWNGTRLKILGAHLEDGNFTVDTIQPAGKKPMSITDFLAGHSTFSLADIDA